MKPMDRTMIERHIGELDTRSNNDETGVEFWYARDVMRFMGYTEWRNFSKVIGKAKDACRNSGIRIESHFQDTAREVALGSGAVRSIDDVKLTRYACYLIAQNGDPHKEEVALLQSYFAVQTRNAELIGKRMGELSRIATRQALADEEKQLHALGYQRGVDDKGFRQIHLHGDRALFGMDTREMKMHLGVSQREPLADRLHPIAVTAKQLATQMTNHGIEDRDLHGTYSIDREHSDNNKSLRKALVERGVAPEDLPAAEDIKRVKRRAKDDERQIEGRGFDDGRGVD
jgi:DNA-damage-inducible protein D